MKQFFFAIALIVAALAGNSQNASFVNVFIGTDGTGHTFPGPSMPFGMVQPGPDNRDEGWNHTSGYQFKDTMLLGFSQMHLSGTGIGEMGNILLMPFTENNPNQKNSYFKDSEKASAGYYTLTKKDGVKVELTCTERVAFHKYTFPDKKAKLLVDFQHGLKFMTDSLVLESDIKIENPNTISGYCKTKGWVIKKFFFVMHFNSDFIKKQELPKGKKENAPKYIFAFNLENDKVLLVKIALSTVSAEGAKMNMKQELPGWDFDKTKSDALAVWNQYLNRIDIDAPAKQKEIFYTSLYHLLLQPSNIADVDGHYRGADDKLALAKNLAYYSTLSIWDIYRAAFPLLQILVPEKIDGIANTLIAHHKAAGFLPIWTAWGQDNYCMIGNHSIPMLLSAYKNGFRGFDAAEALQAMVETSTKSHINSNWELYNQFGYYPFDKLDNEAVSRTLESGYDDWCVARMAEALHKNDVEATFDKRANYYKNLFDESSKLFRGKDTKRKFRTPFDPLAATSPMNNPGDYTEANAWQYFWTPAQYDINGIKGLLGGQKGFTKQLDTFFTLESPNPDKFLGQEAMIGQYAHGNEPSHHIIYLYAFSDSPKTGQRYIRKVVNEFNNNTPDGMIGNDDCGQMSAWYILSCLGFYPVNSADGNFVLGVPQFSKAVLHLANKKDFIIEGKGFSKENIFSTKCSLNAKPLTKPIVTYQEIMAGGKLIFEMEKE